MKPRLNTYCLHSLQGQFFGCHFLRPFLKAFRLVNSFSCKGTNPRFSDLGRSYFRFCEKQILHLALQNWNYLVNYN